MLTAVKQQTGIPATEKHSLDQACTSLQRTLKCYKSYLDRRLCNGREMISIGDSVLTDVSDGVTKIPKLGHAVEGHYQGLRQNQHTVFIQRKELIEWITVDRAAIALWQTGMPPLPLESASEVDV